MCGLGVFAFASADYGRQYLYTGALGKTHDLIHDLVYGLLAYLLAAFGAMGGAYSRPKKAEIVIYLRNRTHGGARVF